MSYGVKRVLTWRAGTVALVFRRCSAASQRRRCAEPGHEGAARYFNLLQQEKTKNFPV
ncbi:hypothetical protein ABIG06_002097 [Bradyrhizobium sp. USDA 326]